MQNGKNKYFPHFTMATDRYTANFGIKTIIGCMKLVFFEKLDWMIDVWATMGEIVIT